jgi:cell division protein FtsQ
MRSRRIAVRRGQGRRRLRRLALAFGVVALVVAGAALTQTPLLDVDRVIVSGAHETDRADVLRAARIQPGDSMVDVDAAGAAARVERLPWVGEAGVARRWPGTVEIALTEREPAALVTLAPDRRALVDAAGWVLAVTSDPPAGLAELTGVGDGIAEGDRLSQAGRDGLLVLSAMHERLPGVVVAVSTELDAALADGGEIRFGSTAQLDDKVVAAETVLADVELWCLEVLDLRVPGSPALTRNQTCS